MTELAESRLRLEPTALAVRSIGPWLLSAIGRVAPEHADVLFSRAELAVHEACMNIIDHANLPAGSQIELELELRADGLTVRVRDIGDPFDLDAVPKPQEHTLQERGYGVKVIRALASELSYRRDGDTNELALRFDIGSSNG